MNPKAAFPGSEPDRFHSDRRETIGGWQRFLLFLPNFIAAVAVFGWLMVQITRSVAELSGRQELHGILAQESAAYEAVTWTNGIAGADTRYLLIVGELSSELGILNASGRSIREELDDFRTESSTNYFCYYPRNQSELREDLSRSRLALRYGGRDSLRPDRKEQPSSWYWENIVFSILLPPTTAMSADALLAIAIICSATIGSLVYSVRARSSLSLDGGELRSIVIGIASGFIIFLSIKGGKQVFLANSSAAANSFNPYSSALLALVSGLFTERFYRLVSSAVDLVVNRFDAAMRADNPSNPVPEVKKE